MREMSTASPLPVSQPRQVTNWTIDPAHSSVMFRVRHMMVSDVRGEFGTITGTVTYDPETPEAAKVRASIAAASIHTRDVKRDAHLRSPDFLDSDHYPTLDFVSTAVRTTLSLNLEIEGDLTIRGTTRRIVLLVEGPDFAGNDPSGKQRMGASARATIKRSDFGMTWNAVIEAGGVLLGDEVRIEIDVSLVA